MKFNLSLFDELLLVFSLDIFVLPRFYKPIKTFFYVGNTWVVMSPKLLNKILFLNP